MIRTVLFDMGNVLLHFSHERMCAQMGQLCGWTAAEVRSKFMDSGWLLDFERGRYSENQFHEWFQDLTQCSVPLPVLRRAMSDIFTLNEPLMPMLKALRLRGLRLVLLSNTSVCHYEFVRQNYPALDDFDDLVLSFRAGAVKPEQAIFDAALGTIGCAPSECFYTDDIPAYVSAGRAVGLDAEVFTDAAALRDQLGLRGLVC